MKSQSALGKMSHQACSRSMPRATQRCAIFLWFLWFLKVDCHEDAPGRMRMGCCQGGGWVCAAASATDLVPEGVTFKPIVTPSKAKGRRDQK